MKRIKALWESLRDKETAGTPDLVVDITGTGSALTQLLRDAGLRPQAALITGGAEESLSGDIHRVAKTELVSNLVVAYQSGRLRMAKSLPLTATLVEELQTFKLRGPSLKPEDGLWREGQCDDLVFAVALAAWRAARRGPHFRGPRRRRERSAPSAMGWML